MLAQMFGKETGGLLKHFGSLSVLAVVVVSFSSKLPLRIFFSPILLAVRVLIKDCFLL